MQMDVQIMLHIFCTTKEMPQVTATIPKLRFVGSNVYFHIASISSHCLHYLTLMLVFNSHMRQNDSAATGFFAKITRFTKNSLDLKNVTRFKISALKLPVLLETIYLCTLQPKNPNTICKFC